MRRERVWLLLFACGQLLFCNLANGQSGLEREASKNARLILENIFNSNCLEESSSQEYFSELQLYLTTIESSGLLLNAKGIDQLELYGLLSSFEASSLKSYLLKYGQILSFAELLLIPGLDREKLELLRPLLRFYNDYYVNEGPTKFRSSLLVRSSTILEKKEGYRPILKEEYQKNPESRYLGNPFLLYGQYRIDAPKNVSATLTLEQDAGEKGLDYISWNFSLKERGLLNNLIIGSYTARKGQGLILWNGFSMSSSWNPSTLLKRDYGITPYTSVQEDRAFKGVAATISRGAFTLDLLTSFRDYDARVTEKGYTSLLTTGLHNTPLTIKRKGTLHSNMVATSISYNNNFFSSGVIVSASYNSLPYAGRDSSLIKMESKRGRFRGNAGVNWRYITKKAIISGELAFDMCGHGAAITGVSFLLKSGNELSILGKYYSPLFVSPLSYLSKLPGTSKIFTQLSGKYLLSKSVQLYSAVSLASKYSKVAIKCDVLTKNENKSEFRLTLYRDRFNLRADYRKQFSEKLLLHSRVDCSACKSRDSHSLGYLIQQEFVAPLLDEKLRFSCRLSYFNAPLWGNRIYSYERDVLNQFRTALIYGKGLRWYLNMKLSISAKIDSWLKYSCTYYRDRDKIGEGTEMISAPSKSEIKVQFRVKF